MASEFLSAGLKIQPVAASAAAEFTQPIAFVAYYLVGHSIELSLKAFLLSRGVPITALRKRPYGHNLAALLREARRRKLGRVAKLSRHDVAVVNLLNACYGTKKSSSMSQLGTVVFHLTQTPWQSRRAYRMASAPIVVNWQLTIQSSGRKPATRARAAKISALVP